MSRRIPLLLRSTTVLGAAVLALAACSAGGAASDAAGGTPIPVTLDAAGCTPSSLTAPAGRVVFHITNGGDDIGEFEILDGDRVVDELENIVPGTDADFTTTVEAGEYEVICYSDDAPRATLSVTPAS